MFENFRTVSYSGYALNKSNVNTWTKEPKRRPQQQSVVEIEVVGNYSFLRSASASERSISESSICWSFSSASTSSAQEDYSSSILPPAGEAVIMLMVGTSKAVISLRTWFLFIFFGVADCRGRFLHLQQSHTLCGLPNGVVERVTPVAPTTRGVPETGGFDTDGIVAYCQLKTFSCVNE